MAVQYQPSSEYTPFERRGSMSFREIVGMASDRPTLELVRIGDLMVDDTYQREVSEPHVRRIVDRFDWSLFFALGVSRRQDGTQFVFDGQHRLLAAQRVFGNDEKVPAIVVRGLDRKEEARLFYAMQTSRKPLSPLQRYRAQLSRGEPAALEIQRIVESWGFHVNEGSSGSSGKAIQAIQALESLYYPSTPGKPMSMYYGEDPSSFASYWRGEERLDWVLQIAYEAWRHNAHIDARTINALYTVWVATEAKKRAIDLDRLVKTLRLLDPTDWSRKARHTRTPVHVLWADEYNRRLSKGRRITFGTSTNYADDGDEAKS